MSSPANANAVAPPLAASDPPPARHPLRNVVHVCWFLLGALFIFSGLVKLNDPVGTALKFDEYIEVFTVAIGPYFGLFKDHTRLMSIVFCSLEVILGVALLLRWHLRQTLWALLGLLVFFTFLTFYSAAFNKVTDCGCFGDFIKLTPWTSFSKDVVLLGLWGMVFFHQRFLRRSFARGTAGVMYITIATAVAVGIGVRALGHLPYFDFLPYKVGNDLVALRKPQEAARYRYTFARQGVTKEFDAFPADSTWKYQTMTLLNPETSRATITDFTVFDRDGNDATADLLTGNKLILLVQNTNKADRDNFLAINALLEGVGKSRKQITALALTSTNPAKFDAFRHDVNLAVPFYTVDGTVIKSMIRSNPGLLVLQNGVVRAKYHFHDTPKVFEVEKLF